MSLVVAGTVPVQPLRRASPPAGGAHRRRDSNAHWGRKALPVDTPSTRLYTRPRGANQHSSWSGSPRLPREASPSKPFARKGDTASTSPQVSLTPAAVCGLLYLLPAQELHLLGPEPRRTAYGGTPPARAVEWTYLWLFRHRLRFPHALVLRPVGTAIIWLANAVRIAAPVAIGPAGWRPWPRAVSPPRRAGRPSTPSPSG